MKKERLELPDILRGFAVLSMILIHILNMYGSKEALQGPLYHVLDFLSGPPAAPVFMFTMGFFFMLKRPGILEGLKRGMLLVAAGYGLNFCKGFLPVYIARHVPRGSSKVFPALYTNYYLIFCVEILIFAGLAYAAMTLLSRLSKRPVFFIGLAAVTAFVSPFLWGTGSEISVLRHFLNPFWGPDTDLVIFPFFPWIVYPLFGAAASGLYMKYVSQNDMYVKNRTRLYVTAACAGAALIIPGGILLAVDFDRYFHDYGQQGRGAVLAFSGFILLWGCLLGLLNSIFPSALKTGFLRYLSRNITRIYIFQWLIIGWLIFIIPLHSLPLWAVCAVTVPVTALSCVLTEGFIRLRRLIGNESTPGVGKKQRK